MREPKLAVRSVKVICVMGYPTISVIESKIVINAYHTCKANPGDGCLMERLRVAMANQQATAEMETICS